jgi:hypothetical protein
MILLFVPFFTYIRSSFIAANLASTGFPFRPRCYRFGLAGRHMVGSPSNGPFTTSTRVSGSADPDLSSSKLDALVMPVSGPASLVSPYAL